MKLVILAILTGFILLAGCTQEQQPVPDFPSEQYPPGDLAPIENQTNLNQSQAQNQNMPQMQNQSQTQDSNASKLDSAPQPPDSQSNQTLPAKSAVQPLEILDCMSLDQTQVEECATQLAIDEKNVHLCTYLQKSVERFSCITQWCLSASRDFTQCETLESIDERLGCLNKCNLNPNR